MRKNNKKAIKTLETKDLKNVKGGHYDTGSCPPWHDVLKEKLDAFNGDSNTNNGGGGNLNNNNAYNFLRR